jgi:hypothetical protein
MCDMQRRALWRCLVPAWVTTVLVALALSAMAAETDKSGQSLEQAANDPTASLMAVQIQNSYSGDFHLLDDEDSNTLTLRAAIPFTTGPLHHIARATLPVVTLSPSGKTGFGDAVLFDLIVFNQPWGRWGIGPVMLLPTASHDALGADKWALGPALGFVAQKQKLLFGVFNQNLFAFAGDDERGDVNVSIIQPLVTYSLPQQWAIGLSEMNITYDWEQNDWMALPLGVKLSKLHKFGRLPVQFSGYYEYNLQDDFVAPKWTVNFTLKFLFPI